MFSPISISSAFVLWLAAQGAVAASLVARQDIGGSPTCLNPAAIQTGSSFTGQEEGTEGIKPGQAPSATDNANFVNFCAGSQLTNGMQITSGSCNGIPMGRIPAVSNMITAIITNPKPGDEIPAGTPFNIVVQTRNLRAGFFVNPTTNYYTAPQDLDEQGNIIGHCHVTVQDIGDLRTETPPDPSTFAFFKGIDDAGNNQGLLQAVVPEGLPVGTYRVCTMIAAQNHQPVNMPVAQRGAQDDCTKFTVVASGNGNAADNNVDNGIGEDDTGRVIDNPVADEPQRGELGTDGSVDAGAGAGAGAGQEQGQGQGQGQDQGQGQGQGQDQGQGQGQNQGQDQGQGQNQGQDQGQGQGQGQDQGQGQGQGQDQGQDQGQGQNQGQDQGQGQNQGQDQGQGQGQGQDQGQGQNQGQDQGQGQNQGQDQGQGQGQGQNQGQNQGQGQFGQGGQFRRGGFRGRFRGGFRGRKQNA